MSGPTILVIGSSRRPKSSVREVYFIKAAELELIKIGVSDNPRERLKQLQGVIPDKLALLGVQVCDRGGRLEKELHKRFETAWKVGEWFHVTPELEAYIEENAGWPMPAKRLQQINLGIAVPHQMDE